MDESFPFVIASMKEVAETAIEGSREAAAQALLTGTDSITG